MLSKKITMSEALRIVCSQEDIHLAFRKDVECGFDFYFLNGKLERTPLTIGERNTVKIEIPQGAKRVISFHTHPPIRLNNFLVVKAIPSHGDLIFSLFTRSRSEIFYICIGAFENGCKIVRCFELRNLIENLRGTYINCVGEKWENFILNLMRKRRIKYLEKRI